jgi:hypothetical protein
MKDTSTMKLWPIYFEWFFPRPQIFMAAWLFHAGAAINKCADMPELPQK